MVSDYKNQAEFELGPSRGNKKGRRSRDQHPLGEVVLRLQSADNDILLWLPGYSVAVRQNVLKPDQLRFL
jgi:hypothetical protein